MFVSNGVLTWKTLSDLRFTQCYNRINSEEKKNQVPKNDNAPSERIQPHNAH